MADMTLDQLVQNYLVVREAKAKKEAAHKAEISKFTDLLDKLEGRILGELQAQGVESARTKAGTAYQTTRTSATVQDWDAFFEAVKKDGAWDLLERRCSKIAVEQYKSEHGELPPGVKWTAERVVNVRRSD